MISTESILLVFFGTSTYFAVTFYLIWIVEKRREEKMMKILVKYLEKNKKLGEDEDGTVKKTDS